MIKVNNLEWECMEDLVRDQAEDGLLIEVRKDEFYWTHKKFIRMVLGFAKLLPFDKRIGLYWIALKAYLCRDEIDKKLITSS